MNVWKKCSSCKKEIPFSAKYYACSVSSCNGKRTGYVFCSIACWERHLPGARHRDAAAIEKLSPPSAAPEAPVARRRIISSSPSPTSSVSTSTSQEILVVVSKLKAYIKSQSDMNTSQDVMELLSDRLRTLCDQAIEQARADGRKTVMARDF